MRTGYSVNRIEIVVKVSIEFAAALRAFAAKLLQRRLEPSLLDSQRTKSPLVDMQRQFVPSQRTGPGASGSEWFVNKQKMQNKRAEFSRAPELV